METRGPSIVLKTHKCLLVRDMCLLADGIVDVHTIHREHFAIYASLGEVNFLAFAIDSSSYIYDFLVGHLLI